MCSINVTMFNHITSTYIQSRFVAIDLLHFSRACPFPSKIQGSNFVTWAAFEKCDLSERGMAECMGDDWIWCFCWWPGVTHIFRYRFYIDCRERFWLILGPKKAVDDWQFLSWFLVRSICFQQLRPIFQAPAISTAALNCEAHTFFSIWSWKNRSWNSAVPETSKLAGHNTTNPVGSFVWFVLAMSWRWLRIWCSNKARNLLSDTIAHVSFLTMLKLSDLVQVW
jgi:hypothetical protein